MAGGTASRGPTRLAARHGQLRAALLAVGVLHASFNASGALGVIDGGWQQIPAVVLLTLAVAVARRRRPA